MNSSNLTNKFSATVCAGLLVLGLALPNARADQMIYANGIPNYSDAFVSDPTFPIQYGDDFLLSSDTLISGIGWFGAYKGGDLFPDGPDHFSMRFSQITGTGPAQNPFLTLDIGSVFRQQTQFELMYGNPVYEYRVDFAPQPLSAGNYLLSIVNDTTGQSDQWLWLMARNNETIFLRWTDADAWQGPFSNDVYFEIYSVPEPSAPVFVVLGLLAYVVGFRASRARTNE